MGCCCATGSGRFVKRREIQRERRIDQKATVAKSGSVSSVATQSPPLVMSENALASAVTTTVMMSNWRSGNLMPASMPLPPSTPRVRSSPPYNDCGAETGVLPEGWRERC